MQWQKWIPNTKVSAGAAAAALAFLAVYVWDEFFDLTTAEAFAIGSALSVFIAYMVPERKKPED